LRAKLRRTIVITEKATHALTSPNAAAVRVNCDAIDQFVTNPLMVAFAVIMDHVFGERTAEVPLAQRYEAVQTFLFDRPDKAFRVRIAVRRTERSPDDAHRMPQDGRKH
jgi:hypothetical protein